MLTENDCRRCADELLAAERARRPIAPPSRTYPGMTIEDAYRIQRCWQDARRAQGARLVGYKIGLTSRATQSLYQATEPMYGRILDDGVLCAGARVSAADFCKPRLEVELAFVLGADIEASQATLEHVLAATERVFPAFEIVAQRTEAPRPLVDAIADNAAFGAIVIASRGVGPREIDLRSVAAVLHRNGAPVESGVSSAVMDHPAAAVTWLAKALRAGGERLESGQVILTGTLTRAVEVSPGDLFAADYGALGAIDVSFE